MKVKVLIYQGADPEDGFSVFGHILGTTYTYQISSIDPANGFSQAGDGFVFGGQGGVDDGDLYYSDGSGASQIVLDGNGNSISDPYAFSQFGSQSVFLAATASVPGSNVALDGGALFMSNGAGTPTLLLPNEVRDYKIVGDYLYAIADAASGEDLYRIDDAGNPEFLYNFHDIQDLFEFRGELFFVGWSPSTGSHFYRADETGDVTQLSPIGSVYFTTNGITADGFYFWQNSAAGIELHISDGVTTRLVKDINPGSGNSLHSSAYVSSYTTLGNKLIFAAHGGGAEGSEVWVSDGTEEGTFVLTGDAAPGSSVGNLGFFSFTPITVEGLGLTFFQGSEEGVGAGLFATNGTREGTYLVEQFNNRQPTNFYTDGNLLYFSFGSGNGSHEAVWISDGTAEGTHILSDPSPGRTMLNAGPSQFSIVEIDVANLPTTFEGTDGNDILNGFDVHIDQTFLGHGGDDTITPGGGSDSVDGGTGSDTVVLAGLDGAGHDLIEVGTTVYALDRADGSFDTIQRVETFTEIFFNGTSRTIGLGQVETFDANAYAASYNDLAVFFRTDANNALSHYLAGGFGERREVSFDAAQYLANWADLAGVFGGDLAAATQHFLLAGVDEHRLAEDPLDYIASYGDLIGAFDGLSLAQTIQAGLAHYHGGGFVEGRRNGIDFDAAQYLANYADLAGAFSGNDDLAAWHFINSGHDEHRLWEDPLEYVASYGDLIGAFGGGSAAEIAAAGLAHFQVGGYGEGRRAGIGFDADQYLANYADLRAAFADGSGGYDEAAATLHFIQSGYGEGRTDDVLVV